MGYSQLITESTNFEPNKNPSCIDLIFTNQPNLISDRGVIASLCSSCHHQIIYAKINFQVVYPPPFNRLVWHFNRAQVNLIQRSIRGFDWKKAFNNLSVNEQVEVFTNTLLNIFKNFIPHELVKVKPKDPPWMSNLIKSALRRKNRLHRKHASGRGGNDINKKLEEATDLVCNLITTSKAAYYKSIGEKLNDPTIRSKTYWSVLNSAMGKKKIPSIPPIFENNSFISDFKEKAHLFNLYFVDQCTLLDNGSIIPDIRYKTNQRLGNLTFSNNEISKILKNLNQNKAHGCDEISIKMIHLCGDSIVLPLSTIFQNALETGSFPDQWKKGNVVPVHKKESKQLLKNYRPISLLPIFAKVFEKVIYKSLYEYFQKNSFLSINQSGFRSGDSCISQLIAITHELYRSMDATPSLETRGVFLDISKAFDKVWHEGLLFKLKCYGVEGGILKLLENYLHNRKQRVLLNGQNSSWEDVNAGVPQGSILGPLLFLIYINDLPDNLVSVAKLFADDTSIFSTVHNINSSAEALNGDLSSINDWAYQWRMSFNPDPNKQANEVVFSRKKKPVQHPILYFNNAPVSTVLAHKHLGLVLDKKLAFGHHLNEKISKCNKGIGLIKRMYNVLPRKALLTIYKSFVRPHLDYADVIYDQPHIQTFHTKIESVQYNAALAITGAIKGTSRKKLYSELGLESLCERRRYRRLVLFYKIIKNESPGYLKKYVPEFQFSYNADRQKLFRRFKFNCDYYNNSFFPYCVREWNDLSEEVRNSKSLPIFKKAILDLIRPKSAPFYNIFDPIGLKLLTRLRNNLSHLKDHKFHHGFIDTVSPLCSCNIEAETTKHYLLRCPFFNAPRTTLLDNVTDSFGPLTNLSDDVLVNLLLYGSSSLPIETNSAILRCSITYLKDSKRFDESLL